MLLQAAVTVMFFVYSMYTNTLWDVHPACQRKSGMQAAAQLFMCYVPYRNEVQWPPERFLATALLNMQLLHSVMISNSGANLTFGGVHVVQPPNHIAEVFPFLQSMQLGPQQPSADPRLSSHVLHHQQPQTLHQRPVTSSPQKPGLSLILVNVVPCHVHASAPPEALAHHLFARQ